MCRRIRLPRPARCARGLEVNPSAPITLAADARWRASASRGHDTPPMSSFQMNTAPPGFAPERDLPPGFMAFYAPLHAELTPRQEALLAARRRALAAALEGRRPDHLPPSAATTGDWRIELPSWCRDQRNQMTGPADDAELVVKMLNSGSPGVMLDLEDSMANTWPHLMAGIRNILAALDGDPHLRGQEAPAHGRHPARTHRDLEPGARPSPWTGGGHGGRRRHLGLAVRSGDDRLPGGSRALAPSALRSTSRRPSRRTRRCGGATRSRRWPGRAAGPRTRSSAWRSSSRTRWPTRWRSSSTTSATTSSV